MIKNKLMIAVLLASIGSAVSLQAFAQENKIQENQGPNQQRQPGSIFGMKREINISRDKYNPGYIEVRAGTVIAWTNRDRNPHTVTSRNNAFDSGRIMPGSRYVMRFTHRGIYSYYCKIHPFMRGVVIVR